MTFNKKTKFLLGGAVAIATVVLVSVALKNLPMEDTNECWNINLDGTRNAEVETTERDIPHSC